MKAWATALVLAASTIAAADPRPGQESGRVDPEATDDGDSIPRLVVRGVLFVPNLIVKAFFWPIEKGIWAFDRYQLAQRWHQLFWNDSDTIGLFPTVSLEAGFGLNAGAHLALRDVFGAGERVDLRASAGGRYQQRYLASAKTGSRLGNIVALELYGEYERRPHDPFYGIGNIDDPEMIPPDPIAPIGGGVEARYRHDLLRTIGVVDFRLCSCLHVRVGGQIADHQISGTDDDESIEARYDVGGLTGFADGNTAYYELEVRYDTRRTVRPIEPSSNPSMGGLVAVFGGRAHTFDNDVGTDYWRYGGDLQRFFRVTEGPRVIILRGHLEGVTGGLGEVPFFDLPRLGGNNLRGYSSDRFRDRVGMVGSLDYRWDLSREYSASLFVDVGRVYRKLEDVVLEDMRVGYGISLEALSETSFRARISLMSSIDGGVFVDFSLDPIFRTGERVQRK
ncbi:MAG: BamA/TamA family outer membrane protein [Kofleriaceae bacterium]